MVRGEVFRLPAPRRARGHEQQGARYAVVVQADDFLDLSTVLVSPTSASALAASFRPAITLRGDETRVLVEQTTVVARGVSVRRRAAWTRQSSARSTRR